MIAKVKKRVWCGDVLCGRWSGGGEKQVECRSGRSAKWRLAPGGSHRPKASTPKQKIRAIFVPADGQIFGHDHPIRSRHSTGYHGLK